MSERNINKINRIAIVSGIMTIIAVITFFAKGFGSVAIAQQDIQQAKNFQEKQEKINEKQASINEDSSKQFSSINTNLEWIKDFLKNSK